MADEEYVIYQNDKTVIIHPGKCLEYLKKKAKEGDMEASYQYGRLVFEGEDVPYYPKMGILFILRASMSGHPKAKERLKEIERREFKYATIPENGDSSNPVMVTLAAGTDWEARLEELEEIERRQEYKDQLQGRHDEMHTRMAKIKTMEDGPERREIISDAKLLWGDQVVHSIWGV